MNRDYDAEIAHLLDRMDAQADGLDECDVKLTEISDRCQEMARDEGFSRVHRGQLSILAHKAWKAAVAYGDLAADIRERTSAVTADMEASRWRETRAGLYEVIDEQIAELLDQPGSGGAR